MSRVLFSSQNRVGETMTFHTNSSSATTFDPVVTLWDGERVSWDLGEDSSYEATNNVSHTYSDNGDIKKVVLRTSQLGDCQCFQASSDNIVGHLDMSGWDRLAGPCSNEDFNVLFNLELTAITHTYSPETFTSYKANLCNLTGNHDLSMFPNFGGQFFINSNPNLTGITHTYSPIAFTRYLAYNCDLTGTLDLSMFPKFGKDFRVYGNPNLTRIIHTATTETFTNYQVYSCDITGNHDISMLHNLGTNVGAGFGFTMNSNPNLTGITHTYSPQVINEYTVTSCDITGNHDVSMLDIAGQFSMGTNPNLTGVTHISASTRTFTNYNLQDCGITGTHDISMFTGLGKTIRMYNNPNLTDVKFPLSTELFYNDVGVNYAIMLDTCDLDYVNFLPLSGVTMDVNSTYGATITLEDNNMSVTDVNHMLVDFDYLSSTANPFGWTGVTLDISGTNATPDSSSGGYDGIAALSSLTGATNNWSITTS